MIGFEVNTSAEEELLISQLSQQNITMEERSAIHAQLKKVCEKNENNRKESFRNLSAEMRSKLDSLLTAEQKAKLAQIRRDVPDYLKNALAGMKAGAGTEEGESGGTWRPGIHSWVPGMGAPQNQERDNREAPRTREPQERRVPD
jgi:hypothetical protein